MFSTRMIDVAEEGATNDAKCQAAQKSETVFFPKHWEISFFAYCGFGSLRGGFSDLQPLEIILIPPLVIFFFSSELKWLFDHFSKGKN